MTAPASEKVFIVGIGDDGLVGLSEQARRTLQEAELIFGSEHMLALLPPIRCEKVTVGTDLREVAQRIERNLSRKRMVVLAGGDPLFYGTARYLCDRVGKEHFDVVPHVSSMQLAFARVKESWEDAYLTNLAGRSIEEVVDRVRTAEKVGLFTSEDCSPEEFARELLRNEIDYFRAYVCENLGSPDERVTQGELDEIAEMAFAPLNVMILTRKPGRADRARPAERLRLFGNADEVFLQSRPRCGLITQAEVRAIALAQMDIRPTSIVWDVGAGSGSVAIEAAQLASQGAVYAIEKNTEDYQLILLNAERFGVKNLHAVHGRAPESLQDLPTPDSIFVGATGRELGPLLHVAHRQLRPGGRLVVNAATLETLEQVWSTLKGLEGEPSAWMVQIARGTHQLGSVRFDALNPTFLLAVSKNLKS